MMRNVAIAFAEASAVPSDDGWLSARESAALSVLAVPKRIADWRLGRWTGKKAAAHYFPGARIEIIAAQDGAPELYVNGDRSDACISISHRAGLAMSVVTVTRQRVGCDIEVVEPRSDEFIESYFTHSEIVGIRAATKEARPAIVNALWSAKESVLKATRAGLKRDTRSVEVVLGHGAEWRPFTAELDDLTWQGRWRADSRWVHTIALGTL